MQDADWDAADFRRVIDTGLAGMRQTGSSATWLLGCHDSPRVATGRLRSQTSLRTCAGRLTLIETGHSSGVKSKGVVYIGDPSGS